MPRPSPSLPRIPTSVQHRARSILCLPLINQAKLIGVLYLENNLTPRVFTPTRITVLKLHRVAGGDLAREHAACTAISNEREAKIRRLVDANILGIFLWNLEGAIVESQRSVSAHGAIRP